METNNFAHIGVDALIAHMLIHSLSPQGRRLVEQMYTGDPFNIDIKLDSNSKNRTAEIANTYLKTIGRRLVFEQVRKKIHKITISPVSFDKDPTIRPVSIIPLQEYNKEGFDIEKYEQEEAEFERRKRETGAISPLIFEGRDKYRED